MRFPRYMTRRITGLGVRARRSSDSTMVLTLYLPIKGRETSHLDKLLPLVEDIMNGTADLPWTNDRVLEGRVKPRV